MEVKEWVLAEAGSILASMPGLEVVFVADGAPDLWKFADQIEKHLGIDDMHKVLDAYHAFERMKKAFDAYHGEGSAESLGAFEEHRKRLKEDTGWKPQISFHRAVEQTYQWFCSEGLDKTLEFDFSFANHSQCRC